MRNRLGLAVLLLVAWGVAAAALARDDDPEPAAREARTPRVASPNAAPSEPAPTVLTVRRAQGVPASWAGRAASARGVERVVSVRRGQALLRRSSDADGRTRDRVRARHAIPLDTLVADTRAYASMLPADARHPVESAGRSEVVMSRSGATLRRIGRGGVLELSGGARLRVAAVVDDSHLSGAEMLVARAGRGV